MSQFVRRSCIATISSTNGAVARNVNSSPRILSRLLSSRVPSVISRSNILPCFATNTPMTTTAISRSMSATPSKTTAADALMDLIQREYDEEKENNSTAMPEALKDMVHIITNEEGWKIVNDDDTAMTKLYKTIEPNNVKVQICFHCQDETERMSDEDYEDPDATPEGGDNEDENEEEERAASVRFTATVTKQGKTLFMVCIAEDSMIRIQNVVMAGSNIIEDMDAIHASGIPTHLYQGPEFTELAEDVQDAFSTYVDQYLGINSNIATYISMQFDYKEQCQYVKFLSDTKSILG